MCQPGEGHCFYPVRIYAVGRCSADMSGRQQRCQPAHQCPVMGAAPADQQGCCVNLGALQGLDDGQGGQLQQGGLYVLGFKGGQTAKVLLQPGQVEHFAARTFWAFGHEERIAEQRIEQLGLDLAAGRPLPVPIKVFAALQVNPGIEEDVPRAAVETGDRLARLDQAEVAEPADIQYRAIARLLAEQGFMKGWNQWSALAAGSDIAAAEVADDRDVCQLGEKGRVADLNGKASGGFMANRLAMATNRPNVLRLEVLLIQQGVDALRSERYPLLLCNCRAGDFIRATGA